MKSKKGNDILDLLPWAVVRFNPRLKVTSANLAAGKFFRLREGEDAVFLQDISWVGQSGGPLAVEEHPVARCFATGKAVSGQILGFLNPLGNQKIWIEGHAMPEFEEGNPKPAQVVFTFHQMSNRHIANSTDLSDETNVTTIRGAKNILESDILDRIGQAVIVTDIRGNITYVNNAATKMYGWAKEELLVKNVLDTTVPESSLAMAKEIMGKLVKGESWAGEFLVRKKDGTIFPAFVTDSPVFNEQGELTGIISISSDISDRIHTEIKLKESEAHYRTLLSSMGQGFCIIEKVKTTAGQPSDFRYIAANPAFEQHTGLVDVVGKTIRQVVPNADQAIFDIYDYVVQKGEYRKFESYIASLDFWIEAEVIPAEKPAQVAVLFSNISVRKHAEEDLRRRETLLNEMGRIASIGGWELDCTTMKQQWTDETYFIHDREKGTYDPNSTEELSRFEPGSKELIEKAFEAAMATGKPYDLELEMTTKKGNRKWVRAVCSPLIYGGKVKKLTGTVQDITVSKQVEKVLRESESRFSTLFKLNPSPVGITSAADYSIIDVNEAWCRLTGYAREEVIGHTTTELALTESGTLQQIREILKEHNKVSPFGISIYTRSGQERQVVISTEQIELGGEFFFINTLSDITEIKQADRNRSIALTKYKALFDNFPMGITVSDKNGNIIEANDTAENLLGISAGEQRLRHLSGGEWKFIGTDGAPLPADDYASVRALNEGRKIENVEMGIVKPDKSITWISVTAAPVLLDDYGVIVTYKDITERKNNEENLAKMAERLSLATNSAEIGIWDWDLKSNELVWDQRMLDLYGLQPGEFNGAYDAWLNGVHPDDREESISIAESALQSGGGYNAEFRVLWPDGSVHWLKADARIFRDEKGVALRMVGVNYNITEQKQVLEQLRESEERFRSLYENSTIGLYRTTPEGEILLANPAIIKMLGYSSFEEIAEWNLNERVHYKAGYSRDEFKSKIGQSGKISGFESGWIRKDGAEIFVRESATAVTDESGEVKYYEGTVEDITERKQAEEKIRITEKFYRTIIEKAPDGVCLVGADGKMKYASPSAFKIFNYPLDTKAFPLPDESTHPEDLPLVLEKLNHIIQHPDEVVTIQYRFKTYDNTYRWIESTFTNQYTEQGIEAVVINFRDIDERKHAEQKLRESERKLKLFVEFTPAAIAMFDTEMRYIATSKRYLLDYDVHDSSIIGRSHYDIFPETGEDWKAIYRRCLDGAIEINEEDMISRADGSVDWVRWEIHPWYQNNEKIGGIILFSELISERKGAEEKLRASESKFKAVFDNAPVGISLIDSNRNLLESNNMLTHIVHMDETSLADGAYRTRRYIREDGNELTVGELASTRAIAEQRPVRSVVNGIVLENGETIWTQVSAAPLGPNDSRYVVITQDITDRKKAVDSLEENARRLRKTIETTSDGFWIIDSSLQFVEVNQSYCRMSGYTRQELLAMNVSDVEAIETKRETNDHVREIIQKGGDRFETTHRCKDGSLIDVEVGVNVLDLEQKLLICFCRDITERKQAEKQLRESEKRFSTIFEDSPVAIAISRLNDGVIIHVNTSFVNLVEMGASEILGQTTTGLGLWALPDDRQRFVEALSNNERVEGMETVLAMKSGERRHVLVWGDLIHLNGEPCMMAEVIDITVRKKAEQQLLEREAELLNAQELAKMASWRIDLTNLRLSVSENYRKLIGVDDATTEIDFDYFISRVHPEDVHMMNLEKYDFTPESLPVTSDFRILMADGSVKWLQNSMVGVFEDGKLLALKGSNIDITDKKNQEEAIRSQNQKLNAILNSLPDKLFVHDSAGNFIEAYTTDPGGFIVPIEQFIGKNLMDIFPKDVAELNLKYLDECLAQKKILVHEFSTDYKGTFSHFEVRVVPFMEDKLIRFVRDITERKEIEQQIRKLNKAIEQSPVAIVITDTDAAITYISPAFTAITGYGKNEIIGKSPRILNSGKNSAEIYKEMWRKLKSGRIWEGELINKKKDGILYWEHLSITPLIEGDGQITGYLAVKEDVTEKKKNEQEIMELNTNLERKVEERTLELKQANEELVKTKEAAEEANKAKSIFLANMSHEIRTPLNSIIGFSELLCNSSIDEKKRSQVISIRNSGRSLLKIINDILDLSKVEAGKIVIEREPLNVFKIVSEVGSVFEQKAIEKTLSLTVESETDLTTPLLLDETRLRQVLFNVIGNAIKFTAKGGVAVVIHHKDREDGSVDLRICVTDTGIGIPEDQLNAIFEPFVQQQGQAQKTYGGTGLGLAISRRMVEAMGGEISVKSVPNLGSEFTICLKNVAKTDVQPVSDENYHAIFSTVSLKGNTILLVDDVTDNRKLLFDALEPTGARLLEARNGAEAIVIAKDEKPDLILMDIRMPVMDGFEACRVLKSTPETANIPCIAVSASIKLGKPGKDIPENFDEYLMKPVAFEQLFEVLLMFLEYDTETDPSILSGSSVSKEVEEMWSDELQRYATEKLLPMYLHITRTQLVDEIEDFGKMLVEAGNKYNNQTLAGIGRKIGDYVEVFDVEKLAQTLHEFQFVLDRKQK